MSYRSVSKSNSEVPTDELCRVKNKEKLCEKTTSNNKCNNCCWEWRVDGPAEIPDDDPCASVLSRKESDGVYFSKQLFLRLKKGIAQNVLQTGFVLVAHGK